MTIKTHNLRETISSSSTSLNIIYTFVYDFGIWHNKRFQLEKSYKSIIQCL